MAVLRGRLWLASLVMLLPVMVFWSPWLAAIAAAATGNRFLLVMGLATYGIQYVTLLPTREVFAFHRRKSLFFPLVAVVVLCCFLRVWYYYAVQGSIRWRDRVVQVRGQPLAESATKPDIDGRKL